MTSRPTEILVQESDFLPIPFDENDNLEQERLFPASHRARRSHR